MAGRDAWRSFRELCKPEWSMAFRRQLEELSGQKTFTYVVCVTRLTGDASTPESAKECWGQSEMIRNSLGPDSHLEFLDLETIWRAIARPAGASQRPAGSEIGRLAQLLSAAGIPAAKP